LLVSDRLQVANAATLYQTKAIERAALANTNTFIATKVATSTFNSALANTNAYIASISGGSGATWAALTSTNTAIRLLVSDRLQIANAAAVYQTKAIERAALANTNLAITNVKTGLTSTNTAIRLLVSDRLQVANAAAVYQTKAIERAALANTNLAITNVKTGLTSTNTAIRLLVSDRLQVANAAAVYATKSSPTTSGLHAHTGRATISTNLTVSGNTVVTGVVANASLGAVGSFLATTGTTVFWYNFIDGGTY